MSSQSVPAGGAAASESTLFLRKATGLVRSWSVFDAFVYAFFSINLVTLGFYIISEMWFLEGGLIPTLVISGIIILAEVVVYASLIAVMPRAGGDYVWQSRILGGGIGFVLAVTGWWFILWLWTPLYSDMLRQVFFVPLLGVLGLQAGANFFSWDPNGWMIVSVLMLIFVTVVIALGMKTYARVQKFCFWAGNAGLLIVCLVLLFSNGANFKAAFDAAAIKMFGAAPGAYDATVKLGTDAGAAAPLFGDLSFAVFLAMPYLVFFNLWPNWGATLYGEVKGASDFRKNLSGMAWALIATTVLGAIFFILVDRTITWDFMTKANAAYWNYRWGYSQTAPAFPAWPYPALLAMFLVDNPIIQFIVLLAMSMWFFGWAGTIFLSSTRVIFAAAFDRLLPEKMAEVDSRTRTPVYAMLAMIIPGLIVCILYVYNIPLLGNPAQSLTLCSTLVIAVTYVGSTIAAIVLPYVKKDLYEASPIAKYKIAGVPMITVAGVIFLVFLAFLLFEWLLDPNALYGIGYSINDKGVKNIGSLVYVGLMYVIAIVIYVAAKSYRKSHGVDIDKVYKEIPVE